MNLRILTLLSVLVSTLFASAHDFEAANADGVTIYYKKTSSTEVAVTYRGYDYNSYSNEYIGSVNIPSTVRYSGTTYTVTSIGDDAFRNNGLTTVTIPGSVTSIGISAFFNTGIYNNKANWTDGVLYIDDCLIRAETSLSGNYAIKTNTRLIAADAFFSCHGLTSVTIPGTVTSIGYGAFLDCSRLTSVTIPNSVTSIGDYAFYGCDGLTSVTIPSSVTTIGENAFGKCRSLTAFYGKSASEDNRCLIVDDTLISFAPSGLTSYTIPGSVTSIGACAFHSCSGLTAVTIGNSVASIGYAAFYGCSGLTSVTIPNSVTSIDNYAFKGCSGLTELTIGKAVTEIGQEAFADCSHLVDVYAKMDNPRNVTYGLDVFKNLDVRGCWLFIPVGTKSQYSITHPWRNFEYIIEMDFGSEMMGDCNGDGEIDAADIAHIVDYLLGISHDGFDSNAADLNGDGKVDATDISLIIRLILSE